MDLHPTSLVINTLLIAHIAYKFIIKLRNELFLTTLYL